MSRDDDIIAEYSDLVYRLALMKMGNKTLADDVFQEVFLKYMKYKNRLTSKEHEKAWFIRVTISTCKAHFLSSWRKHTVPMDYDIPFESTSNSELYYKVMALPDKYRIALYLFYYEGYAISDIAKLCKKKETTIKTHLKRGRELLRRECEGDDEVEEV